MAYFKLVRENVETDNFDLINFLRESPLTPESDRHIVSMTQFNLNMLRNCIIYNIYCQGLAIKSETSRRLVAFLDGDFGELTKKTYLQVLLHYTKMDINTIYDSYSNDYDRSGMPNDAKLSRDEYFDFNIKIFVMRADSTHTTDEIREISGETSDLVRKALFTRPVLLALQVCLNDILTCDSKFNECSVEWLIKEISNLKIYTTHKFTPFEELRGACLIDGILLCIGELNPKTELRKAELITLAVHECVHYLARCRFSDFNFSSPFKYLSDLAENRSDLVIPKKHLEIGRTAEVLLFDGIQPWWPKSSEKAARQFLSGLFHGQSYPVISEAQRKNLMLTVRIPSTPYFGIDIYERERFYCWTG